MRVPDEVLKCVVFIGREKGVSVEYIGTGFFVALTEKAGGQTFRFNYLVTANHVANAVDGAPFKIRANNRSGQAAEISANEFGEVKWYRHSKGDAVDVAVCDVTLPTSRFDTKAIGTDAFLTRELAESTHIGAGDEVLITGLFSKITGDEKNIPIVRVGHLAMAPDEPIVPTSLGNIEAYVVEVKSLGGISGSPVFIRQTVDVSGMFLRGTNIPATAQAYSNVVRLLGLAHGHWNVDLKNINDPSIEHVKENAKDAFNVGLAIVVPSEHILEVLHNAELTEMRTKIKARELAKNQGATMDSVVSGGETTFTKEDFEQSLTKATRKIATEKQ